MLVIVIVQGAEVDKPPVMKTTFPDSPGMSFLGLNGIVGAGIGVEVDRSVVLW